MFKMVALPLTKQRICKPRFGQLRNLAIVRPVRRFVDPKNDIAFNKLFAAEQNKPLLLSFLNSILRRKGYDIIEEVELLPQELPVRSILDVSCRDRSGRRYIVEMQNKRLSSFIQRLEYYASSAYSGHLFRAVDYLELKPLILLVIANYKIFPKEFQSPHCISYHSYREEKTNKCFLPNLSYVFIELPKFDKRDDQLETPEDYWVHLLKEAANEDELPKDAPSEIQAAYEVLERHRWNSADIKGYEKTMMAILDVEDAIKIAKEVGREEGREEVGMKSIEEAREKAREEGREEGIEEGIEEARKEIALNLSKTKWLYSKEISDVTGLSVLDVEKLLYSREMIS